jgi:hypothetical protein
MIMKNKLMKSIFVIVIILVLGTGIWVNITYSPDATALNYTVSTDTITIVKDDFGLSFIPFEKKNTTGIIFYPGAKVEPEAYSPLAFELAEKGYMTVIVKMPLNLAVIDSDRGKEVIDYYKDINRWYIGGHSLGGAMAGNFAYEHNELIEGVFFLGAYPVKDLTDYSLDVLLVNGSLDAIIDEKNLKAAEELIPKNSLNLIIEGGNHSQFGSYGLQKNDQVAEISFKEQLKKTVEQIIQLVENIH